MRLIHPYVCQERGANGRNRVEGQIKESEEKVGKKRNEVSTLSTPTQSAEELVDNRS